METRRKQKDRNGRRKEEKQNYENNANNNERLKCAANESIGRSARRKMENDMKMNDERIIALYSHTTVQLITGTW
jgi:hypothetical protein